LLTVIGSHTPLSLLWALDKVVRFLRLGRWMADQHFRIPRRASNRNVVFDSVSNQVRDRKVIYLEFGVFRGAAMKYWSQNLKHPESVLHGFDSFEGLPESWSYLKEGSLTTGGQIPEINDPRVKFFKGWFDDVLPTYHLPEGDFESLIINIDADLYSSTVCIFRHFRKHIRPGTFIYFDDLSHPDHEPRAFEEFMRETGLRFRLISATRALAQAFFVCKA
jgi:hypothetical protein